MPNPLKARLEALEAKQAELAEAGNEADARLLDSAIAEVRDMIVEASDEAEPISYDRAQAEPVPTASRNIDFRDRFSDEITFAAYQNAATTGTEPGQHFVGEEWHNTFLAAVADNDPLANRTYDITTGSTHNIPVITGFGEAIDAEENVGDYVDAGLTATTVTIGAFTKVYKETVTDELMQDSLFDLNAILAKAAGAAMGAKAFAMKIAAAKASTAAVKQTMKAKTFISFEDVVKTLMKLPAKYRRRKSDLVWIMSSEAITQVMTLVDNNGRPIYQEATEDSFPRVHGIEVIEADGLDALGTTNNVPFLIMNPKGIVYGVRGNMTYKQLMKDIGAEHIYKQRMDAQPVPLPMVALAQCASADPAA